MAKHPYIRTRGISSYSPLKNNHSHFSFKELTLSDLPIAYHWFNLFHLQLFYFIEKPSIRSIKDSTLAGIKHEIELYSYMVLTEESTVGLVQIYPIKEPIQILNKAWRTSSINLLVANRKIARLKQESKILISFIEEIAIKHSDMIIANNPQTHDCCNRAGFTYDKASELFLRKVK